MGSVNLILPHQLFENSPSAQNGYPVYLVEEFTYFRRFSFHKQKLAFHRATMKFYEHYLLEKNIDVTYVESTDENSDVKNLIPFLKSSGFSELIIIDPTDTPLKQRINETTEKYKLMTKFYDTPLFYNTSNDLKELLDFEKEKFLQTSFYTAMRKKYKILVDAKSNPAGGKWTFDTENRKKYPKDKIPPKIEFPKKDDYYNEAVEYITENFPDNPGRFGKNPYYPINYDTTRSCLKEFLANRFSEFGVYQDAIVQKESFLNHSILSPMMNVGLILPGEVIDITLEYVREKRIPINSTEGFVRQILGWREFLRGMYEIRGTKSKVINFWNFTRKMPSSFYDGTTGVLPVDSTIKKLLKTSYCHHIERLMVLGSFMLLCEFDPREVYNWFMELFIDSYEWVMVPNVYGMSQFADGGLFATKPYINGSNYIMKMSDYPKGDWQRIWDGLFWRFMHVHKDIVSKNPRLAMLSKKFDTMDKSRRDDLMSAANNFLKKLDKKKVMPKVS